MHPELVRTFPLNEISSKYAALSEPKHFAENMSLGEGLIREVFKIQGYWSLLMAETEKACSPVWKPKVFHLKPIISEKHLRGSGFVPMPTENNVDTKKAAMKQNCHPLKGMLRKAIPALSHQLCGPPPQSTTCRLRWVQKLDGWNGMGLWRGNWQFAAGLSLPGKL